jgi:hypothetical protein
LKCKNKLIETYEIFIETSLSTLNLKLIINMVHFNFKVFYYNYYSIMNLLLKEFLFSNIHTHSYTLAHIGC